jgi:hypothetical protein
VKVIDRYVGRNTWQEEVNGEKFDIFNASSFCSNLLIQLARSWHPHVKSRKAFKIPIYIRTYKKVIGRIINRRTSALRNDDNVFAKYPLSPYKFTLSQKQLNTKLHLKGKYSKIQSLPVDAPDSCNIMPTELEYIVYPYKGVTWDTLSPRKAKCKRNKLLV